MADAFVIIQIGSPQLDGVYEKVIAPAIRACGLSPKRVDKHNKGGLLKSEIIKFIQESEIVVADLTNQRPNCYLEVGYVMGWSHAQNLQSKLILTCREDHNPDSPNHHANGPRVHFDLSGYDICYWFPEKPELFQSDLMARIRRRRKSLASNSTMSRALLEEAWVKEHRERALKRLQSLNKRSFIEAAASLPQSELAWSLDELHTASFPVISGPIIDGRPTEQRFSDGIVVESLGEKGEWCSYWTFQRNGHLYTLSSLPEETRSAEGALSAKRRVLQTAWLLACCQWFYVGLAVSPESVLDIEVRQSGLRNRALKASRYASGKIYGPSAEDAITSVARGVSLADIVRRPELAMKELLLPFFEVFGFPAPEDAYFKSLFGALLGGQIALWSPD